MQNLISIAHTEHCGIIAYWALEGALNYQALENAWDDAGLPTKWLPCPSTKLHALQRACQAAGKGFLVRPLSRKGFALVKEHEQEDGTAVPTLEHQVELRVRLHTSPAHPSVSGTVSNLQFEGNRAQYEHVAQAIALHYVQFLQELDANQVSMWMTKLMEKLQAVSLRPTGGVYFVPKPSLENWEKVKRVLGQTSHHRTYQVPAMHSEDAVEAVLHAVTQEAEQLALDYQAEVDAMEIGSRAFSGRVNLVRAMKAKLQMYEQLLQTTAPQLQARLDDLCGALAQAALMQTAKKVDEEDMA